MREVWADVVIGPYGVVGGAVGFSPTWGAARYVNRRASDTSILHFAF